VLGLSSRHLDEAAPSVREHERSGIETRLTKPLRLLDDLVVTDDAEKRSKHLRRRGPAFSSLLQILRSEKTRRRRFRVWALPDRRLIDPYALSFTSTPFQPNRPRKELG